MQKTSLKLLLVFVEYTESNARLVWDALRDVDATRGRNFPTTILHYSSSFLIGIRASTVRMVIARTLPIYG